ncbi:MAG: hypothetical protein PHF25_02565 [Candidatus Margulisbacteria bacterium]|nr:hypothetical protein [Candidatus Margulisiibacteriota bacterium]
MRPISLTKNNFKVLVNPAHGGRIQQLYYKDVPLLYVPKKLSSTSWTNYGGDFLWLAPQQKWGGWPPVKEFDSLAWDFLASEQKIEIKSAEWNGLVLGRTIYFQENDLIVENSFFNQSATVAEWGLWNISQLSLDDLSVIFTVPELKIFSYPEEITVGKLATTGNLFIEKDKYMIIPQKSLDFKVGGIAKDNKLICNIGNLVLEKEIILTKKQQKTEFPHQCNIEVYKNDNYLEAELVWPMVKLKPEETFIGIQKFSVRKG